MVVVVSVERGMLAEQRAHDAAVAAWSAAWKHLGLTHSACEVMVERKEVMGRKDAYTVTLRRRQTG